MDWHALLKFAREMFLRPDGAELSPDFARDIAFTGLTFVIGWVFSLRASKGRLKGRIIGELIMSQRELVTRAYPEVRDGRWRMADSREVWMLEPFVARIKFLIASLQEEKNLGLKQLDYLERYVSTLEDFIAQWANTSRRGATFHYKYRQTYIALREAVKALGLHQMKRLGGLMPRDELLNGLVEAQGGQDVLKPLFGVPGGGQPAPAE